MSQPISHSFGIVKEATKNGCDNPFIPHDYRRSVRVHRPYKQHIRSILDESSLHLTIFIFWVLKVDLLCMYLVRLPWMDIEKGWWAHNKVASSLLCHAPIHFSLQIFSRLDPLWTKIASHHGSPDLRPARPLRQLERQLKQQGPVRLRRLGQPRVLCRTTTSSGTIMSDYAFGWRRITSFEVDYYTALLYKITHFSLYKAIQALIHSPTQPKVHKAATINTTHV